MVADEEKPKAAERAFQLRCRLALLENVMCNAALVRQSFRARRGIAPAPRWGRRVVQGTRLLPAGNTRAAERTLRLHRTPIQHTYTLPNRPIMRRVIPTAGRRQPGREAPPEIQSSLPTVPRPMRREVHGKVGAISLPSRPHSQLVPSTLATARGDSHPLATTSLC